MPLPLSLLIMLAGITMLWFSRRQRTGKLIVSTGFLLLLLCSYNAVSEIPLKKLEDTYPSLSDLSSIPKVKKIVILGGGHISDPRLPVTDWIGDSSLRRLIEGIRIKREIPDLKIILSGGRLFDSESEASVMAGVAAVLGIDESSIIIESKSKDTAEQARNMRKLLGSEMFILVTTAAHMSRAVTMFTREGMRPLPAPTDYLVKERKGVTHGMFFPTSNGLEKMYVVFHEYLGSVWEKLKGGI